MEQLSNELRIQMVIGQRRNLCLLCEKGKTSFSFAFWWLNASLAPPAKRKFTSICGSAWPKRSPAPLSMFEDSKAKGKTRLFGEDRVSRNTG